MNSVEWENLRSELTPFLNRLACAADADPGQHEQMRVALLRFQDALRDAYPPDCAVSLRSYLTRHLARFAYALDVALRPEPSASCANEILPQRSATTLSIVNADLSERSDLRGRDWLAQMERWPNCLSLAEAVSRLESPLREAFAGHYYECRSFTDIALRLNLAPSAEAIGCLIDAALDLLRVELASLPLVLK